MSPPLITTRDWFIFGLNCQKTYDDLEKLDIDREYTVCGEIHKHFMDRMKSLIVSVHKELTDSDKFYDMYDACAKRSVSELQTIRAWCKVLEEKIKQEEDLPSDLVYDFGLSHSIVFDF